MNYGELPGSGTVALFASRGSLCTSGYKTKGFLLIFSEKGVGRIEMERSVVWNRFLKPPTDFH
jgi:hypothetical protein